MERKNTLIVFSIASILILGSATLAYAVPDIWTAASDTGGISGNSMRGVSMSDASNGVAVGSTGTIVFTSSGVPVGGTYIPIDKTALLLAGVQSISMWMIPVVIAGIGIGIFVIKRRN